jgi:hypothetical protein
LAHADGLGAEEGDMGVHASRRGIAALTLLIGSIGLAPPVVAEPLTPAQRTALTTMTVPAIKAVRLTRTPDARAAQSGSQPEPSFFKTRKGAIAVGLMAAGGAFTVWSISHDNKPVKSPIR